MNRASCTVLLMLFAAACGVGDEGDPVDDSETDADVMAMLPTYRSTFVAIDRTPYTSALGAFPIVDYVNPEAAPAYAQIHPESTAPHGELPVGTLIVREVLDGSGAVTKLTLMAKGPPGYDPTIGDWWFGVTDAHGVPAQTGRLAECHGCHIPRAAQDYLFGVPAAKQ